MSNVPDVLVLSPHLDDAVLSCGGGIASRVRAGEHIQVITVFAADEPTSNLSPLARELHAVFNLDHGIAATRRDEDAAAMQTLGCAYAQWDEVEAIYRRHPVTAAPLYPDLPSLFGSAAPGDEDMLDRLCRRFADFPKSPRILVPLGIGGQVDHCLIRQAAETCMEPDRLTYYEDYPYAGRPLSLWRVLRWRCGWRACREPFDKDTLEIKLSAIACYASQITPLFAGEARMRRRVTAHWKRRGRAERGWQRTTHS